MSHTYQEGDFEKYKNNICWHNFCTIPIPPLLPPPSTIQATDSYSVLAEPLKQVSNQSCFFLIKIFEMIFVHVARVKESVELTHNLEWDLFFLPKLVKLILVKFTTKISQHYFFVQLVLHLAFTLFNLIESQTF